MLGVPGSTTQCNKFPVATVDITTLQHSSTVISSRRVTIKSHQTEHATPARRKQSDLAVPRSVLMEDIVAQNARPRPIIRSYIYGIYRQQHAIALFWHCCTVHIASVRKDSFDIINEYKLWPVKLIPNSAADFWVFSSAANANTILGTGNKQSILDNRK